MERSSRGHLCLLRQVTTALHIERPSNLLFCLFGFANCAACRVPTPWGWAGSADGRHSPPPRFTVSPSPPLLRSQPSPHSPGPRGGCPASGRHPCLSPLSLRTKPPPLGYRDWQTARRHHGFQGNSAFPTAGPPSPWFFRVFVTFCKAQPAFLGIFNCHLQLFTTFERTAYPTPPLLSVGAPSVPPRPHLAVPRLRCSHWLLGWQEPTPAWEKAGDAYGGRDAVWMGRALPDGV